jgi:hypothetical protein
VFDVRTSVLDSHTLVYHACQAVEIIKKQYFIEVLTPIFILFSEKSKQPGKESFIFISWH